ncbi:hypothetical protein EPUS_04435 [Endocarpon pusillum Z07020]|uniref:RNase III domain-containing protein n=1 Tax=Endocarpon pusillum (strain Z07020 / HMAS-L-300199) TaxID=1263415 RepID=U1I093_ENDPU|nr:uncharacterized protein EPUS_04435 [Endocarpon pusillum Z07020]ERF76615.1 hypothetical protein EPUS_04435 [Endocarpon pusillum Z07020]
MAKRKLDNNSPAGPDEKRPCFGSNGTPDLPPIPPINKELSKTVFTHQSVVSKLDISDPAASYERLEFLGDAYIELMATRLIWDKFKDLPVGRLSQLREMLVKNETLANIAVMYGLDKQIVTAPDVKTNRKQWAKVKGDVVEAYVAAIVEADTEVGGTGFLTAQRWLYQLWIPHLAGDVVEKRMPDVNAKDALSRKVVSRGVKLEYLEQRPLEMLKTGQQKYYISVFLTGWGYERQLLGTGEGLSKTGAGNLAAEDALHSLLVEQIAEKKREFDRRTRGIDQSLHGKTANGRTSEERMTREKEIVAKKRSMFMSSEFG